MKTKIVSLLITGLFFFPLFNLAQDVPFDELVKTYENQDGVTTVVITSDMFSLFSSIETDEEAKDFQNLMNSLNSIKIINIDKSKFKEAKDEFFDKIMNDLPKEKYTELMSINEKDQKVKFYIKKLESGKIAEMIMISSGDDDNTMISISGLIDLNDISKLSHTIGIKGLENLEGLENNEYEMQKVKEELEKSRQEIELQRKELERQRKEMEKQMQELEEEKRK